MNDESPYRRVARAVIVEGRPLGAFSELDLKEAALEAMHRDEVVVCFEIGYELGRRGAAKSLLTASVPAQTPAPTPQQEPPSP